MKEIRFNYIIEIIPYITRLNGKKSGFMPNKKILMNLSFDDVELVDMSKRDCDADRFMPTWQ